MIYKSLTELLVVWFITVGVCLVQFKKKQNNFQDFPEFRTDTILQSQPGSCRECYNEHDGGLPLPLLSSYSPFLWVCGSLLAAFCLWSRWMPPTSWSGLEDARGPEEEGEKQSGGGREGDTDTLVNSRRDLFFSSHGWWTWCLHAVNKLGLVFGPHGNRN